VWSTGTKKNKVIFDPLPINIMTQEETSTSDFQKSDQNKKHVAYPRNSLTTTKTKTNQGPSEGFKELFLEARKQIMQT